MQDEYVSTEHLLLAIADEKDGAAGRILRQHGVNRDEVLKALEQVRGTRASPTRTPRTSTRRSRSTRAI